MKDKINKLINNLLENPEQVRNVSQNMFGWCSVEYRGYSIKSTSYGVTIDSVSISPYVEDIQLKDVHSLLTQKSNTEEKLKEKIKREGI